MKLFKQIDFIGQVALIVLATLFSIIKGGDTYIYSYCMVAAWQVLSAFIHVANGWHQTRARHLYENTIYTIFFVSLASLMLFPLLLFIAYFLLVFAPALALFYLNMCYKETYQFKRPSQLI